MPIGQTSLHAVVDQDGAAILDVQRSQISTLNATGAYVWQALNRGELVEGIVAKISRETGVPTATVKEDVLRFLETLKEAKLWTSDAEAENDSRTE